MAGYTVAEFAKKHRKAVGTVHAKIAQGKLNVERIGGTERRAAKLFITDEDWPAPGPGGSPTHRGPRSRPLGTGTKAALGLGAAIVGLAAAAAALKR